MYSQTAVAKHKKYRVETVKYNIIILILIIISFAKQIMDFINYNN